MKLNKNKIAHVEPRQRLVESFSNIHNNKDFDGNVFIKPFLNKRTSDENISIGALDLLAKEWTKSGEYGMEQPLENMENIRANEVNFDSNDSINIINTALIPQKHTHKKPATQN
jgi:hypothetical protein